ncbi:MAG: hypothetical protein AAB416_00980 [Patescibacteria group bacterium]
MKRLIITLLLSDMGLIALHIFLGGPFDLFNLDRERNIPSYFSGAQLILIASVSLGILLMIRRRIERILLGVNAFFFLMLGFDEISELHENITYYLVTFIKPFGFFRTLTYMWLVFFAPVILAAFVFFALFFKKIIAEVRGARIPFGVGIGCFAAAIFMELGSGLIRNLSFHRWEVPIEEGFELIGASAILIALLTVAANRFEKNFRRVE